MTARERRLLKTKLGSEHPQAPVPEGYQNWLAFLKTNKNPPAPYKSWFEFRLFGMGRFKGDVEYEPKSFPYTQEIKRQRRYTPDGVTGSIWIEAKGRFRTKDEADKYISVRDEYPDIELVFIFAKRGVKMPGARKRKDGSIYTMEEWCEKNNFYYCFEQDDVDQFLHDVSRDSGLDERLKK